MLTPVVLALVCCVYAAAFGLAGRPAPWPLILSLGVFQPVLFMVINAYAEWRNTTERPSRTGAAGGRWVINSVTNRRQLLALDQDTLRAADLTGARLTGANLHAADLWGACLQRADLSGAWLGAADLDRADLRGARLVTANVREASFRDADLRGADFRGEGPWIGTGTLCLADWTGALYDGTTRWPPRFDPRKHGCILVGPDAALPLPASAPEGDRAALPLPASEERPTQTIQPNVRR